MQVLRTAPAHALLAYYVGSAPFVLGLLFYWSDMSRSAFAVRHLVGGALGMSLLFEWMKVWQSVYAGILRARLSGEVPVRWTAGRVIRVTIRQLVWQPSGLFLLLPAFIVFVPFGWLYAFYQNVVVLGTRGDETLRPFTKLAWRQALLDGIEHNFMLSMLFFFGMFVSLNIAITALALPFLLRSVLGMETPFTLSFVTLFNSTFLAVICGITYLVIDPLVKAIYVLRCFHGESRRSGEDLLVELKRVSGALATMVLILLCVVPSAARAGEAVSEKTAPAPAQELNQSIDQVLRKPEYTWRAPREKRAAKEESKGSEIWEHISQWLDDAANAFGNFLKKLLGGRSAPSAPFSLFSDRGLAYMLTVIVAAIIGLLLYIIWRMRFSPAARAAVAEAAGPAPDLSDENVTAEQLPEDGWVTLALEMIERGELRLALRAFYLASLAHLAERNLVALARFKSNRDYERELLRRSHALPDVARLFSQNVTTFDRVWYGLHEVTADLLQEFRLNVERIKSC